MSRITSQSGFGNSVQNSISTAISDLSRYPSWKKLRIVDVPIEGSLGAFEWLIEQYGHNEFDTSYGPTWDSEWFGPFVDYSKPAHHSYVLKDIDTATLFKVFHG